MRAVFRKRVVVVGDEGVGKTSLILTRLQGAVAAGGATASISGSPDHPGSHRREGSMDGSGAIRSRHRDVADEIESNPLYRMPPAPTVLEDQYDSVDLLGYTLVDTSGSHSLDRLRPYSYEGATGFLVCFSVGDPASLQEVTEKWVPEIKYFAPGVPFSLLACKVDLREDPDALAALKSENLTPISAEEGEEIALKVGASRRKTPCNRKPLSARGDATRAVLCMVLRVGA
ncbi:P-loop containing nucleoside triphosphate hydrolase protein [Zopfochytrium polystomum]|nr:P-loop containing nucleoside triphosphate hydrolase protein [Zopfochytrium polystomum]